MTASFECPKCGGPLSLQAQPGDKTVVCSFCGETVIIPEDLRVPLPTLTSSRSLDDGPAWWRNWMVVGVILIALFGLGDMTLKALATTTPGYVPLAASIKLTDEKRVDTELTNAQATFEANTRLEAQATAQVQATLQALQPTIKKQQNWPVVLQDNFSASTWGWDTGPVSDDLLNGSRDIAGGKYLWDVTSVSSVFEASYPTPPEQTDFFASVDIKYNSMPDDPSADGGLVFRYNSADQTWYYFSVNKLGQYYFGLYDGRNWTMLIPDTDSSAFRPGETNRLAVGAQGAQFIFLINDQIVANFSDPNLKTGQIGLGVNLPQAGQKANFEYSNFAVLAPTPAP